MRESRSYGSVGAWGGNKPLYPEMRNEKGKEMLNVEY